jgi:hypothetical protein
MNLTLSLLVAWLLPVLIAFGRGVRVRTRISIAILSVALGWTVVGWVAALLWALEAPRET